MDSPNFDVANTSVAWIGRHADAHRALMAPVTRFEDSDDFLLADQAFEFGFFIVELAQQGVSGVDLVRLIRRRTTAGILALCNPAADQFVAALESGADAVLNADVPATHLRATVSALSRRIRQGAAPSAGLWTLRDARSALQSPDGALIPLSESDLIIMRCFVEVKGGRVDREVLVERLWGKAADKALDNALHATLYRLRKRIEHGGQRMAPIHAVSRLGYEFRAPLAAE